MAAVAKMMKGEVTVQGHTVILRQNSASFWVFGLALDYFRRYLPATILFPSRVLGVHVCLGGSWVAILISKGWRENSGAWLLLSSTYLHLW